MDAVARRAARFRGILCDAAASCSAASSARTRENHAATRAASPDASRARYGDVASPGWNGSPSAMDVERAVRRVNRRIQSHVMTLPKRSRCLEEEWRWDENCVSWTRTTSFHGTGDARIAKFSERWDRDRASNEDDAGLRDGNRRGKYTLIFLHGFCDTAENWREMTEMLVRGVPGGVEVLLPSAPSRLFQIGDAHRDVAAWFEPRMNNTRVAEEFEGPGPSNTPWRCGGIDPAIAWTKSLIAEQEKRGAARGSVVLMGFSQGAGLAMAAAASETAWSPALGGVACLRGYLPITKNESDLSLSSSAPASPPQVLICQGGRDVVAPREWGFAAAEHLRAQRRRHAGGGAGASEDDVQVLVSEDMGHELSVDDVWRARWWLRGVFEESGDRRDDEFRYQGPPRL
jgi:predicted esterase